MTKAALLYLAMHLVCEMARKNVRVNSISPRAICTPINMNLPHMKDPEKRAALEAQHLLGLDETIDIANACEAMKVDGHVSGSGFLKCIITS